MWQWIEIIASFISLVGCDNLSSFLDVFVSFHLLIAKSGAMDKESWGLKGKEVYGEMCKRCLY